MAVSPLIVMSDECDIENSLVCWDGQETISLDGLWRMRQGAPDQITHKFLVADEWLEADYRTHWGDFGWDKRQNKVSYHLAVDLGTDRKGVSLFPGNALTSYRVLVKGMDGKFIRVFSNIDDDGFALFETGNHYRDTILLPTLPADAEFIIQVSNGNQYSEGRVFRPLRLGLAKIIEQERRTLTAYYAFLFGIFILLGFFNFSQWLANRGRLDQLFLSLTSLTMAARLLETGRLLADVTPGIPVSLSWQIAWGTMFLLCVFWLAFIRYAYPQRFNHKLLYLFIWMNLAGLLMLVFLPDYIAIYYGEITRNLTATLTPYLLYGFVREILANPKAGRYLSVGSISLILFMFLDVISYSLNLSLFYNAGNIGFLIFTMAMTQFLGRRYNEALADNELLEENSRLREDVERIVQHDLKTPLNAIMGYPQLLRLTDNLTEKQKGYLDGIESSGRNLLNMINLTLDLYKMESGTYKVKTENVELSQICKGITEENGLSLKSKGLVVDTLINGKRAVDGDQFILQGESLLFYSMLSNLFKNAIEASPENERITIAMEDGKNKTVSIHNRGSVPADIRDTFFEKYVTTGKVDGTGLGTYSAGMIAETMGGQISLDTSVENEVIIRIEFSENTQHV